MNSIYDEAGDRVVEANTLVSGLLDLTEVPTDHPLRRKVLAAFGELSQALNQIPKVGRRASLLGQTGPMVFVCPNEDMRDWPTSYGQVTGECIIPHVPSCKIASKMVRSLNIPESLRNAKRTVISWREFVKYLDESLGNPKAEDV